jgi:hypothetical protein
VIAAESSDLDIYGTVSTNLETLHGDDDELIKTSLYPHIATNGENLVDIFATFVTTSGSSQEVNIMQVDP